MAKKLDVRKKRGRKALHAEDAKRIRQNLGLVVRDEYASDWNRLSAALDASVDAVVRWRSSGRIDLRYLIALARLHGLSLNWLVLGIGPVNQGSGVSPTIEQSLRELVREKLRTNDADADRLTEDYLRDTKRLTAKFLEVIDRELIEKRKAAWKAQRLAELQDAHRRGLPRLRVPKNSLRRAPRIHGIPMAEFQDMLVDLVIEEDAAAIKLLRNRRSTAPRKG